jgi:hypothetical protein
VGVEPGLPAVVAAKARPPCCLAETALSEPAGSANMAPMHRPSRSSDLLRSPSLLFCCALLLGACGGGDESAEEPSGGGLSLGGSGGVSGQGGAGGASGKGGSSAGAAGAAGAGAAGASGGKGGSAGAGAGQAGAGAGEAAGGAAGFPAGTGGSSGKGGGGQAGAGGAQAGAAGQAGAGGGQAGAGQAGAGASSGNAGSAGSAGSSGAAGGPACKAPDVLVLLDRTMTMHFTPQGVDPIDAPDYKSSKWSLAIGAIEQMVTPPADATIRFGLELWPKDPGGDACITQAERITQSKVASNPFCQEAEVVVPPGNGNGKAVSDALDPATTRLCLSTPTGNALLSARDHLKQNAEPGREQYVMLVTDGADWDQSCPDPSPLPIVQELAADGIKTFVVGFSAEASTTGGVGLEFLNDMACAGQTAKGFPGSCKQEASGYVAIDSMASPIFLSASDGPKLEKALQSVAASLCCGCQVQCDAPEVLFALDRTLTMHFTPEGINPTDAPGYKSSKWVQAISAIEKVTKSQDQSFRFGLELWPRDPGDGCITLAERIEGTKSATNPSCQEGEIVVPPALGQASAIDGALDPLSTKICSTTPTGQALITASQHLTGNFTPGRAQYVVLVTDGADWDQSCPEPSPLIQVQKLAASGIRTFVVGFFAQSSSPSGVGLSFLNDMACAGQTAQGFPGACKQTDAGWVAADPSSTVPIFLGAENADQLEGVLVGSLGTLGCKL